jgi:nucleoside 2-deoxyribosyltransferase
MLVEGNIATVISGSYRRHLQQMYALKRVLEDKGFTVLSPVGGAAVNPSDEFVLLDADPIRDHRTLQDSVFAKIRRSSFLVSFNREGYVGKASLLEYGYAIAVGIPILTLEPADDPNIKPYTRLLSDVIGQVEP